MTRITHRFALLGACIALAACATPAPPPEPGADPVAGPVVELPADLAAAMEAWEANGPASYAYTLEMSCFCLHRGRYAVEVRDGAVVSVRDAGTGAASPADRREWIVTVPELLEAIATAVREGIPTRAVYDPRLGYPVEAEIGMLADDSGTLYLISDFRTL